MVKLVSVGRAKNLPKIENFGLRVCSLGPWATRNETSRQPAMISVYNKLLQVCDRSYDCPKYEAEDEGEEEENCDTGESL